MRVIISILIFHKKLIVPTLAISLLLGFIGIGITGSFELKTVGFSYVIIGLLLHYYIYEIQNPNEYYFYFNMGLSKGILWISTFMINLTIGMIMIAI